MRYAAAVPCIAILSGSALGLFFSELPTLPLVVALTACAVSAFWCWRAEGGHLFTAFVAGAFLSGSALLAADAWHRAWRPPLRVVFEQAARVERDRAELEHRSLPLDDEAALAIEGLLRSDAAPGANGVLLTVDVDRIVRQGQEAQRGGLLGRVTVTVIGALATERVGEWRAGRRVRMPALLRRPSRYFDPGVPDHERGLARRGTTLIGTVKSGALVEVVARGGRWDEWLATSRAFSRAAINRYVGGWDSQSAAIVSAIVVGDRSLLDDGVQRRLQEAGTYHVIAISGGNIAILAGLLIGAFRVAGVLGRAAVLAAIAVLIVYAQFVGGGASVDRATLMAVVYLGARALDHRSPPLNALAVVAALLVASNPLSIADPAFLLTFGATLAILIVVPAVSVRGFRYGLSTAAAMLLASVAAEIVLLPIAATLFERVTFAGLGLNFLAIPLMALAQIAGMVTVPAALLSTHVAIAAGWAAHLGAAGLVASADLVSFVPSLTWRVAAPSVWVCILYYLAAAVAWNFRRTRRLVIPVAAAAGLWIVVDPHTIIAPRGDGRLHVTFFDVGQGDSMLVVFPRGSTMLVDAGGVGSTSSFDIGDRVVAPAIRAAAFRRLDRLVLTHGDADHIGGAPSILTEFRPRDVWEGIPVPRFEPLATLRTAAIASRMSWANVYTPYRSAIEGVDVVVWHPGPEDWERQKVRNDDSIVLEIRWANVSLVLTGDVGRDVERTLATTIPPAPLRVVKVPHHGSLTSSSPAFVAALAPNVAVVSAGRSNHFGHPALEVLRRYVDGGAEVFRTDRDGAVFVETDGHSLTLHTFNGRRLDLTPSATNHEATTIAKDTKH